MQPYILDDEYQIASDERAGYILQRRTTLKNRTTGKRYDHVYSDGYYSTIEGALEGWAKAAINKSDKELPEALRDVLKDLKAVLGEIKQATRGL